MNKILIILLTSTLLFSCKGEQKETQDTIKPEVTMYRMNGGSIAVNDFEKASQGDLYKGETQQSPISYYIINHPKGKLVWNTGLPNRLVGKEPFTTPDGNFTITRKQKTESQLKALGLSISDIDYFSFSHTHYDQSGAASVFKDDATWLVQEKEYTYVKSEEIQNAESKQQYYAIKKLSKIQILNGDYDVFGDGTVVIKSFPGHTPGHSVLYVDLTQEGPVLLSGDLYHFNENKENKITPSFSTNTKEAKESLVAFEAFAKANNAKIIMPHNPEDFSETIVGEFLFLEDAAILKGHNFIYGVTIDQNTRDLAKQVEAKKRDQYDMIPVMINGVINPKPEGTEGWDHIVTVKGILEINEPTTTNQGSIKVDDAQTSN